jgi:hypothetical protein
MSPDELGLVARHVVKLLVERRFDELEQVTGGQRLTSSEMEEAVDDIGGILVMPPEIAWRDLDVVAVRNWPGAYSVNIDLWTARGRSDHTVEFTVHSKNGRPVIELDDIHVR